MADNYIGNRMDDYLAGKLSAPRQRKLTPSGHRPGTLQLAIDPAETVWISEGALLPAGMRLIEQLRNAGVPVCYRAESGKAGSKAAIRFGARHFPPEVAAPTADTEVRITSGRIKIDGNRAEINFAETLAPAAADMAASLLSKSGKKVSATNITL